MNNLNRRQSLRIVIGSLGLGGAENHLKSVLPLLFKKGWKIKVLTLSDHIPLAQDLCKNGVKVYAPPTIYSKYIPHMLLRIIRLCINFFRLWWDFLTDRKSITHFFLPEAYILGTLAKILALNFSPAIMSRRSMNNYQKKRPLITKIEYRCHKVTHYFLGNSHAVVNQLHEEGIAREKIDIIYNGIETEPFIKRAHKDSLRKALQLNKGDLLFVIVANLIPYKGHRDLLEAFAIANLTQPWKLLLIGEDRGIEKELKAYAKKLNISQHIMWLGQIVKPHTYLMASDVGMLVSHEEGFSNAILECMAAGLPMIVTDVGGNKEAVTNYCGLIVPKQNPTMLAKAITIMANDPAERHKISKLCKDRILDHFTLEKCADHYHNFYNTIR